MRPSEIEDAIKAGTKAGEGGNPNGNDGTRSALSVSTTSKGGSGFNLSFISENGNYGKGGSCTGNGYSYWTPHAGGGSGGYDSQYINVESLKAYSITVGEKGYNIYDQVSNTMTSSSDATSGFVLIAYGEGIE